MRIAEQRFGFTRNMGEIRGISAQFLWIGYSVIYIFHRPKFLINPNHPRISTWSISFLDRNEQENGHGRMESGSLDRVILILTEMDTDTEPRAWSPCLRQSAKDEKLWYITVQGNIKEISSIHLTWVLWWVPAGCSSGWSLWVALGWVEHKAGTSFRGKKAVEWETRAHILPGWQFLRMTMLPGKRGTFLTADPAIAHEWQGIYTMNSRFDYYTWFTDS